MNVIKHFVNGQLFDGNSKRKGKVFNPATGEQSSEVNLATTNDIDTAVDAAKKAFVSWSQKTPLFRARILFKFKELIEKNSDELTKLIVSEHGKVYEDAKGSLTRGLEVVEFACGIPQLLKGEFTENIGTNVDSWSTRQPLGICAGITPFNFPAMVPMWMFPIALACGNTFVLKPSERDPSASMVLAELLTEAGLPHGVFNVVNGGKEAVDALLNDTRVEAVSFVGSTPIAEYIYQTGTANGKRVQALGGAKNHAVVMPDANTETAVNALMGAAFGSAGERCMAISVAVAVGEDTADKLILGLKKRLGTLKVGSGCSQNVDMGPLVTREHKAKVAGYVDRGVEEGASLVVDGRDIEVEGLESGFFVGACLFDYVNSKMSVYTDEIFGPVLCVVRVKTLQDAMELIDDHEYGNGTCIFTRDGEVARYFTDHIKVGMVGVNVALPVPVASHSFGGWKRSLFGDLAAYGPDGVRFYTRRKTITQRWPSSAGDGEDIRFAFPSNN